MKVCTTRKDQDARLTGQQLIQDLSESEKTELPEGFFQLPFGIQRVVVRRIKRYRDPEYARRMAALGSAPQPGARKSPPSGLQSDSPIYCRFPTPMCRVSVIHPINRNSLHRRPYLQECPIVSNSWGSLTYTGPLLSTYDEDVLFAILALVEHQSFNREVVTIGGRKTYKYTGKVSDIFTLYGRARCGENYAATLRSLKRLTTAVVGRIEVCGRSTRGTQKVRKDTLTNLLFPAGPLEGSRKISCIFNPYFYDAMRTQNVTCIDVAFRSQINSLIGKSLYRFCQSHKSRVWCGDWRLLIDVLNINREKRGGGPRLMSQIRRLIVRAVDELVDKGYFDKQGTGFIPSKGGKQLILKLTRAVKRPPE